MKARPPYYRRKAGIIRGFCRNCGDFLQDQSAIRTREDRGYDLWLGVRFPADLRCIECGEWHNQYDARAFPGSTITMADDDRARECMRMDREILTSFSDALEEVFLKYGLKPEPVPGAKK